MGIKSVVRSERRKLMKKALEGRGGKGIHPLVGGKKKELWKNMSNTRLD